MSLHYCPYCKNPLEPNWSYCYYCNKPLLVNLQNNLKRKGHSISQFQNNLEKIELQRGIDSLSNQKQEVEYSRELLKLEQLLKKKELLGEPVGDILLKKASLFYQNRDLNSALNILESALKGYETEENISKIAIAHNEIGIIQEDLGLFDSAVYHFQMAIDNLKKTDEFSNLVQIYNNLANVHFALHELEDAYKYYIEALQLAKRKNMIIEKIKTSSNLVDVLLLLNKFSEAKEILEYNLSIFKQQNDLYGITLTLTKFGKLYFNLGNNHYEQAYQSFNDALEIIKRIKARVSIYIVAQMEWECFYYLGKLHLSWNNDKTAEDFFLKSLEAVRTFEVDDSLIEGIILESLAELYEISGRNKKAIDYFKLAIQIYQKFGDDYKVAENKSNIAHIYFEILEDQKNALIFLEESLELFEYLDSTKEKADTLHKIGDIHVYNEDLSLALSYFKDALELYQEIFDAVNTDLISEKIRSITDNYSTNP
ncbi:MAG: tetratricopeptide repeat protein [Promethearchaeota archaeon]